MGHRRHLLFTLALLAALGLAVAGSDRSSAQQATPAVQTMPAAIHQGTCQQPTPEPAYDAGDVKPFTTEGGEPVTGQEGMVVTTEAGQPATQPPGTVPPQGTVPGAPVLWTTPTQIEANLDDLLAQPHAFAVHQSPEAFGTIIACGEIGGQIQDDQLVIALRSVGNSGYAGIAILKRDDDNIESNAYVFSQVTAGGQLPATPVGTPAG